MGRSADSRKLVWISKLINRPSLSTADNMENFPIPVGIFLFPGKFIWYNAKLRTRTKWRTARGISYLTASLTLIIRISMRCDGRFWTCPARICSSCIRKFRKRFSSPCRRITFATGGSKMWQSLIRVCTGKFCEIFLYNGGKLIEIRQTKGACSACDLFQASWNREKHTKLHQRIFLLLICHFRYFSLAVCLFGSIANILNIVVLTRRDMVTAPINKILTGLAVADMLVMLEYVPFAVYMIYEAEKRNFTHKGAVFLLCHVHFSQVMHTISIFLTLTLAVWRYIAIR